MKSSRANLIVDAHLDLAYNVGRGRDVRQPALEQPVVDKEIATVGLPDIVAGNVGLICATIFCNPFTYNRGEYKTAEEAHAIALRQFDWYCEQCNAGLLRQVTSASQLPRAEDPQSWAGAIPFILLLEGADAFRSPADVAEWYERGLRIVGLSWRQNRMAGGTNFPGPITEEGRSIVRAMNQLNMIHDTSHLAEESFWQLMEITDRPVIASHSNCQSIVPGDRQLSDEMIKAIVGRGGVIGINFYDEFLLPPDQFKKRHARLQDIIDHIKHTCDLAGNANHVALGTDLDGGVGRNDIPEELTTIADLHKVADGLQSNGFSSTDTRKIMAGNWLRFFRDHLS
jgi:membrane dipeptidase